MQTAYRMNLYSKNVQKKSIDDHIHEKKISGIGRDEKFHI